MVFLCFCSYLIKISIYKDFRAFMLIQTYEKELKKTKRNKILAEQ